MNPEEIKVNERKQKRKRQTRGPRHFDDKAKIRMLVTENPCKPKTLARQMYAQLLKARTVGEYRGNVKAANLGPALPYLRDQIERAYAEVKS